MGAGLAAGEVLFGRLPAKVRRGVDSTTGRTMKSHTRHLTFEVPERVGFLNITPLVEDELRASGIREGLLLCNAMHITRPPSRCS